MFLAKHTEQSDKEKDCYGYCLKQAIEHFMNGEFEKAAIYHENVIRSLRELQAMKNEKAQVDHDVKTIQELRDQQLKADYWRDKTCAK